MKAPYIKTVSNNIVAAADSTLPLGNAYVTGYCRQAMQLNGNSINISDNCVNGYAITVNATFTAPAVGDVTLQVLQNNVPVSGAVATETVATATTQILHIGFTTIIKSLSGCNNDVISISNTGVAANFSNLEVDVFRL